MQENKNCGCEHIDHVKCDVKNCTHNTACCCTAKELHVGPQHACCPGDTVCATFKSAE